MSNPGPENQRMSHVMLPSSVINGFILEYNKDDPLELLPGGCGTCYLHRPTNTVLKPAHDIMETDIISNILSHLDKQAPYTRFKSPRPLKSKAGTYVYEGWSASTFIPDVQALDNRHNEYTLERLDKIIQASRAYHEALQCVKLSDAEILYLRHGVNHAWARAHRKVWNREIDPRVLLATFAPAPAEDSNCWNLNLVQRLMELSNRLASGPARNQWLYNTTSQIVHGDVVGGDNILFPTSDNDAAATTPPAIIDLSPHFAPAAYAEGIILADALIWCHAGLEVLDVAGGPTPQRLDMLRRGLMFRCLSDIGLEEGGYSPATAELVEIERVTCLLEEFIWAMGDVGE